jgi:hypothetical protein
MQDLFTQALGINSPWFIKDVSFDNKQLNIHIALNLVLAGLRLGLKNRQVGEKWVSDDCSYLCKGLIMSHYKTPTI